MRLTRTQFAACWLLLTCECCVSAYADSTNVVSAIMPLGVMATGDEGKTFLPFVLASEYYDSNLFALENSQDAVNVLGTSQTSDYVTTWTAGVNMNWVESGQQLVGHAIVSRALFNTFSQLDNTSQDLALRWNWQLGDMFLGDMGVTDSTQLGNLTYIQQPINDTFTSRSTYFDGYAKLTEEWRVNLGLNNTSYINSAPSQQYYNLDTNSISAGFQYLTQVGREIGWLSKLTNGNYPNESYNGLVPVTDKFTQYDNGIQWLWSYNAKTQFSGNFDYTRHISPDNPAQSYSGFTGKGDLLWAVTGKTQLDLSVYRNIMPYYTNTTAYQDVKGVALTATWSATSKITASMRLHSDMVDYPLDTSQLSQYSYPRHDRFTVASAEMDYQLFRHTKLMLAADRGVRASNTPGWSFTYNDVTLSAQQLF